MIKRFLSLEWKQFKRSASFDKKIAIKILMVFAILYFMAIALSIGIGIFFILKKSMPQSDPFVTINKFLIFYFLIDLALRFFIQQLPFMNVKPLMILPVSKNTIINYLLGKSMLSIFNIIPLFIFIPLSVVLYIQNYSGWHVLTWLIGIVLIIQSDNFINFIIDKSNVVFYIIVGLLFTFIGLEFFNILIQKK